MSYLKSMAKLEWLNLFGTQVGDNGFRHLKQLTSLKHLPVGTHKVDRCWVGSLEWYDSVALSRFERQRRD